MIWAASPIGWSTFPQSATPQVVDDLELAGLDVQLDLDESRCQGGNGPVARKVVPCHSDQACTGDPLHGARRHLVDVVGHLFAAEPSPELDGPLSCGCVGKAPRRIGSREDRFVCDIVVSGRAPEVARRELFELLDGGLWLRRNWRGTP